MTGAVPNSAWLEGCLTCDDGGFIKTGPDLSKDDLERFKWPLTRAPYLLETSLPGVFAVGDVRAGNVKAGGIGCGRRVDCRVFRSSGAGRVIELFGVR
jgi:thioredoxin reductase (NADPH)